MTAWERAMGLIAELTSLDTGYDCCLTGESAINVIRTALADERRRVWEEAAKICDERAKYYKSIKSVGDIHDRVVERLAEEIRAKAHDGEL